MTYREALAQTAVAVSISESPDMPAFGLSEEHLRDAMAEIARHLLALGAHLIYGGDLRGHGFSELLFELVARHRRDVEEDSLGIINYLAWPVHIQMAWNEIEKATKEIEGAASLVCLSLDGEPLAAGERKKLSERQPNDEEWARGLTSMRALAVAQTNARIVLGGPTENYKGVMPGIAEEALMSLEASQPLFVMGGFGGCARGVAQALKLIDTKAMRSWPGQRDFSRFTDRSLNNGLTREENKTLARTPHIDQAMTLIIRGLLKVAGGTASAGVN